MHARREVLLGSATFAAFFASSVALGAQSASATVRVFSFLAGLGAGGACGVFAGLAAHLARGPAHYEPVTGEAGAWGLAEYEDEKRV